MIANALIATTAVFLAVVFWLLQECTFLIRYRDVLVHDYALTMIVAGFALFLNLFAAFIGAGRWLFLKDTGEKLAHLEKQLRTGGSISEELSQRLEEADDATRA